MASTSGDSTCSSTSDSSLDVLLKAAILMEEDHSNNSNDYSSTNGGPDDTYSDSALTNSSLSPSLPTESLQPSANGKLHLLYMYYLQYRHGMY